MKISQIITLSCMLAAPLLATPKLPSTKVRVAVTKAIRAGDANILADVLTKHELHVNSVLLSGGHTMLHEAAAKRSPEVVEYLITNGAQVNVADNYGHTPLDVATVFGTAKVAALLEQAGATHGEGLRIKAAPTATGDNPPATGYNPLQPQEVNNFWVDSFLYAARTGDIETVERRLDRDADINVQDRDGMTALLYAVSEGHTEIVELLLDRDADIEAKDRKGYTALIYAVMSTRIETSVRIETVELLLDHGVNVDVQGSIIRWTALLHAAMAGHIEIVELLIDHGANVEDRDSFFEWMLLMKAARTGDTEAVKLLLDYGVNVDVQDLVRNTALRYAAMAGHTETVALLLDRGADIEAQNINGETTLLYAAHFGQTEIVELLLDRGADIEAKDRYGNTALIRTAFTDDIEIVKLLLDRGAQTLRIKTVED